LTRAAKELKAAAKNATEKLRALVSILDELKKKRGEELKKNKKLWSKFNEITQTAKKAKSTLDGVASILALIASLLGKSNFASA
jgi:hypothetical protein